MWGCGVGHYAADGIIARRFDSGPAYREQAWSRVRPAGWSPGRTPGGRRTRRL